MVWTLILIISSTYLQLSYKTSTLIPVSPGTRRHSKMITYSKIGHLMPGLVLVGVDLIHLASLDSL